MSLEMVVGIMILLIVAVVIINMVIKIRPPPKPDLTEVEFNSKCQQLCNDFLADPTPESATNFCDFNVKNYDWNYNGIVGDKFVAKTMVLPVCESEVYCFQMYNCKMANNQNIGWDDCKNFLCQAYTKVYGNNASQKVLEIIQPGNCGLPTNPTENWFLRFFGSNPCG
jgi:hypothetical protein